MFCLIYCALEPDRMPDTAVYHLPIPSLCTLPCQVAWLFVLLPQVKCQLIAVATSGGIGNGIPTVDSLSVCTGDSCTGVQLWKIIVVKDLQYRVFNGCDTVFLMDKYRVFDG